ncbi:urea transporter [Pseudomonas sp. JL972]|uniref:urea transporter n=1 Tax=Stutzerimonas degradans TaxID=2968968 RepID=UPI0012D97507|nr:urea transporter [Stutzerimonas degradans]MTZ12219.1 urea transporter [Stutzerimonas degradans]
MLRLPRHVSAVLNGFSQIFLQAHPLCGLLIALAIALHTPALLAGALTGALAGTFGAAALRRSRADIDCGLYGYNSALLGVLIVLQLGLSAFSLGLIACAALLIDPLQTRLLAGLRERRWLPGFTLPFVLFGWLVLTLLPAPAGTLASVAPIDAQALAFAIAIGIGIGQVIFLDNPLAGLLVLVAVWLADRRAARWLLAGSAAGLGIGLLLGAAHGPILAGLAGYNPALAALAVSQVQRSAWAPLLAIVAAVLARLAFDRLGLPPLTMPFILACWLVALAARRVRRQPENA